MFNCNYQLKLRVAFQMIKETMDKKFGAPWHVVAGGYFSYDITFEVPAKFVLQFPCLCNP